MTNFILITLARFEKRKVVAKKSMLGNKLYAVEKYAQLSLFADTGIAENHFNSLDKASNSYVQARYYIIRLEQDLFGDYIIIRIYGRINKALGQTRQEVMKTKAEAKKRFDKLVSYREKVRHYELITLKNFDKEA